MTTHLDYTVGIGKEATYGVAVPPTRFFESEAKMNAEVEAVQGTGMRPTKRVQRANRNSIARVNVSGDIDVEISDQSFGFLLEAAVGPATILGTTANGFEHAYTLRKTDPVPSYTIEEVVPFIGGSQNSGPQKFVGCVAESLTIEVSEGGLATAKVSWLGKDVVFTGTATAATYPATDQLLQASHDQSSVVLVSDATAIIKAFSLTVKNNLDTGGRAIGGNGRRGRRNELGRAEVTGSFTAELTSTYLRTRTMDRQSIGIALNLYSGRTQGPSQLGLTIAIPAAKIKGGMPQSNGGNVPEISAEFEVFDNGSLEPITFTYVTTDATPS